MKNAVITVLLAVIVMTFSSSVGAQDDDAQHLFGTLEHHVLAGCSGDLRILSPEGEVVWKMDEGVETVHDSWMLENGNILFADGVSVSEVTKDKEVVFRYEPQPAAGGGAYGCQRLANGNTMIAANSSNRILEVDPDGEIVFEMELQYLDKIGSHNNLRIARKRENGNYLVSHKKHGAVVEYRPDGTIVREFTDHENGNDVAFYGTELPSGNIICAFVNSIVEFNDDGEEVWRFTIDQTPGLDISCICGLHMLENGNIVIGTYASYRTGVTNSLIEITREGECVWRFSDESWPGSTIGVQVLNSENPGWK